MKSFVLKNLKCIIKLNLEVSTVQTVNLNGILGPYNINAKNFMQEYQGVISKFLDNYEGLKLKVELVVLRDGTYVVLYKGAGLSTIIASFLKWKKSKGFDSTVFTTIDLYFVMKCFDVFLCDLGSLGFAKNSFHLVNLLGVLRSFNGVIVKK